MPGLPKKYAKMGFKAGWKAFKKSKNKRKSPASINTTTKKRGPMAKKAVGRAYRRGKSIISNPYIAGAISSVGGGMAGQAIGVDPTIAKAGVAFALKQKAVVGFCLGEYFQGQQITTGGGLIGGL